MKKRIIASILTVIMLMTMLPTAAMAAAAPGTMQRISMIFAFQVFIRSRGRKLGTLAERHCTAMGSAAI